MLVVWNLRGLIIVEFLVLLALDYSGDRNVFKLSRAISKLNSLSLCLSLSLGDNSGLKRGECLA